MSNDTEQHFKSLLAPLFSQYANVEFRTISTLDDLRFSVNWKLRNDPSRPNKRSRRIVLVISQEAFEDYEDGNQNDRDTMAEQIVQKATKRLKQFNPDHNTPYGQPEPEEEWKLL